MKKETIIVIVIAIAIILGNWFFLSDRGGEMAGEDDLVSDDEEVSLDDATTTSDLPLEDISDAADEDAEDVSMDETVEPIPAPIPAPVPTPAPVTPPATMTPPVPTANTSSASTIIVQDQAAGRTVEIAQIKLDRVAWVAVHEETDATPGRILGAVRLHTGNINGTIELLRATEAGKVYYAMLHINDDDGVFDHKKDVPMTDTSGNPIMVKFSATNPK